ncbi:hypothetical protein BpHYR1_015511 [Brachionus plicatilis]|uniref:Uncharacterized protein n=1 Tax=Brachionus plicatilis TaxID=10195 RepID=A0A3M7PS15_BRAPC|nr:hypothetical protein BpHYR1_015511 [Brachionus plicatilis]
MLSVIFFITPRPVFSVNPPYTLSVESVQTFSIGLKYPPTFTTLLYSLSFVTLQRLDEFHTGRTIT